MLRQGADVVSGRLGGAKLEETGVWSINGPGRSPTWWATFPVQREGEKRSPRIMHYPNVESPHQLLDGASCKRRIIGVKTQNSHSRTVPTFDHCCTCMDVPRKDLTWFCGTSHHHHMGLLTLYGAWTAVGLSKRSPVEPGLKDVLCPFLWMQWR